jgi:hypothetical protein
MLDVTDDFYASAGKLSPAEIFLKIEDDVERTRDENRPVCKEVEFIKIFSDPHTIIERAITDDDKARYARLYERFKLTKVPTTVDGTALADLPWMPRARVEEFARVKIFSVEQLVDAKEEQIARAGMGAREDIAKAKAFLKSAKDTKIVARQAEELEQRDARIKSLEDEIKQLSNAIKELKKKS